MLDTKALAATLLKTVRDWVEPAVTGLTARMELIERDLKAIPAGPAGATGERGEKGDTGERGEPGLVGEKGDPGQQGERGEKGDAGINGKDGAPGERGEKGEAGANGQDGVPGERGEVGPTGEKGATGERGEKGDTGERGEPGLVGEKGDPGQQGERGEKGDAGINGKDGAPGERGADGKDADPEVIKSMVAKAIGEIPAPKDGKDGADGKSITVDSIRPMFEAEQAKWALDFERRAADVLQRAIERMPVPKDGHDGLSIEDLSVEHDGDGGVTIKFQRGEIVKEFALRLPRFKDCGVFRDGSEYRSGDGVTWSGSFFIAQKDAPTGKPGECDDWRLAVKRGQNGKDLRPDVPPMPREPVRIK